MITLQEYQAQLQTNLKIGSLSSSIQFFTKQKIDFSVFLSTKQTDLQRDFVWSELQKQELIYSIFLQRPIPKLAMILRTDDVYEIIDGKQRLSTMLDFYNNLFSIILEDKEYYFKDLTEDYQRYYVRGFYFEYDIVNEYVENQTSDEDKIKWFKLINFAGTPQDKEILNKLN